MTVPDPPPADPAGGAGTEFKVRGESPAGLAFFGEEPGKQNVIDAQALVFLEAEHAVIPPGKGLFRLLEETEAVLQAEAKQTLEGGTLGF